VIFGQLLHSDIDYFENYIEF